MATSRGVTFCVPQGTISKRLHCNKSPRRCKSGALRWIPYSHQRLSITLPCTFFAAGSRFTLSMRITPRSARATALESPSTERSCVLSQPH
eukprot:660191-Amphidinium_carterae.1